MRSTVCAYCHRIVLVLDNDWGKIVRCDKLRCLQFFKAERAPSGAELAPRPPPASPTPPPLPDRQQRPTRLTGPYLCWSCKGLTHVPMGFRRRTVVHRPAGAAADTPPCKMSTYAAIYYCPHPGCEALLETPCDQWGLEVQCPACGIRFIAPRDNILHEQAGDHREGVPFRFACPACRGQLQCDSTLNGQSMRGQRVVCLHCDRVIEVPSGAQAEAVLS